VLPQIARVASNFPGGWGRAAGAAHELERMVGGRMHEAALAQAVRPARPVAAQPVPPIRGLQAC